MKENTSRIRHTAALPLVWVAFMFACQSPPPTEAKPAEAKPAEAKPAEAKPAAAKPAAAKPATAKPPEAAPASPLGKSVATSPGAKAAQATARGVTPAACQIVCDHILRLSLEALPKDVDPDVRAKHSAQLAQNCPAGCMKQATIESNNCILRAKTVTDAAACQP